MIKNILTIVIGVVLSIVIGVNLVNAPNNSSTSFGSVEKSNEYQSTTTDSTFPTGTSFQLLACGRGALGSVVVSLGSNSPLELYDATTTVNGGIYGTTTLAKFKTTATAGTYTFDSQFQRGLIVAIPSTVGVASTTITFRGNPVCQ